MSDEARELAQRIDCMINRTDLDLDIDKAATLIDAAFTKMREECSKRAFDAMMDNFVCEGDSFDDLDEFDKSSFNNVLAAIISKESSP